MLLGDAGTLCLSQPAIVSGVCHVALHNLKAVVVVLDDRDSMI
jgi:hypothetical protein